MMKSREASEVLYILVCWWGPWFNPCAFCGFVAWLDGGVWDCEISDVDED
ncbi:unnamed protein product [marine sediment metagenome]|uniref:Uncharacterized protein n=1 Tax=marine sediment metagenome TaxID=412755 RepID=X1KUZ4_9ZZZZ